MCIKHLHFFDAESDPGHSPGGPVRDRWSCWSVPGLGCEQGSLLWLEAQPSEPHLTSCLALAGSWARLLCLAHLHPQGVLLLRKSQLFPSPTLTFQTKPVKTDLLWQLRLHLASAESTSRLPRPRVQMRLEPGPTLTLGLIQERFAPNSSVPCCSSGSLQTKGSGMSLSLSCKHRLMALGPCSRRPQLQRLWVACHGLDREHSVRMRPSLVSPSSYWSSRPLRAEPWLCLGCFLPLSHIPYCCAHSGTHLA